ncbi:MAG: beta-galactosidase GalA [Candidatus Sulfotelmatobacter sp.]
MPDTSRRDFLKTALAASAIAARPGAARQVSVNSSPAPEQADHRDASFSPRERLLLDFGWRFHLGHACDPTKDFEFGAPAGEGLFAKAYDFLPVANLDFDDSGWSAVDLPHDWAVELPFENGPDLPEHGAKPLGREYPATSIGWYRRVFDIPQADLGRRIRVEFDGVFRNAMVMFNGHYVGENFSGYAPFGFDLTDLARIGAENVLTLRVDATESEGWFYEGAGIYRHVWLTTTDPVHVRQWGTYARSSIGGDAATISLSTEVENESEKAQACRVKWQMVDAEGKEVATAQATPQQTPAWESNTFEAKASVPHPRLWSIEDPYLYRVITTVEAEGTITDREETTVGIRSVRFDADRGFFLNGEPVKIKGTCNHQDHAGVGSALPDRLQYYRIERLKEMGSNGYRTSHNPATPELLEACDRLGMIVMGETRMFASTPEGLSQLERMIRRDRNHPSIVIWSIGNEEPEQGSARGARVASSMKRLARKLDPARPITMAMNGGWGRGVSAVVDVQGFNYAGAGGNGRLDLGKNIDEFHTKFPQQPTVGTETGSEYSTRGIYVNDKARGYVNAYDVNYPGYTTSSEGWWKVYDERAFLSGGFFWTGFDYRGEPSPYSWPCISSHFGAMDTCGFPKDNYFYYRAWWRRQPLLHLFPHWNWEGSEGKEIDVWCHTNLESVELFLNGASLGKRKVERNSHVEWKVKYAPGVLEARGSKAGKLVLTDRRETTGAATKIVLLPDRNKIAGDGEDVAVTVAQVVDAQGRVVPVAMNGISFKIAGPARLIGVGNGDPSCHEPDKPASPNAANRSAFNGLCMAVVQALKQPGEIRVEASSPGLARALVVIQAETAVIRPAVA